MTEHKKTIALDFDGVLHSYSSGWQGCDVIPDGPVPGAMAFLRALVEDGRFDVCIHSSRCSEPAGVAAIKKWLAKNIMGSAKTWIDGVLIVQDDDDFDGRAIFDGIRIVDKKPPAFVTIDDRAIQFAGTWPELDDLAAFVPWNKRTGAQRGLSTPDPRHHLHANLLAHFFVRDREGNGNGILPETPMPPVKPPHQSVEAKDNLFDLVARFSSALLKKLQAAEVKYGRRDDWMKTDWELSLQCQLAHHVAKGDPLDVAAYSAFAWHHGWRTAQDGTPTILATGNQVEAAVAYGRDSGAGWNTEGDRVAAELGARRAIAHLAGQVFEDVAA